MRAPCLVHSSDIIRQHQHERAVPSCGWAGEDSAAQDFYGRVVGEGYVIFGGAEGFGEEFQLLIAAHVADGFGFGGRACSAAEEDEEFGATRFFGFA